MSDTWNLFNVQITEIEKEELSNRLFTFHDEYEDRFCMYFDHTKANEELDEFLYWYKGLHDLRDELIYRDEKNNCKGGGINEPQTEKEVIQ